jgi:hypothetical protein
MSLEDLLLAILYERLSIEKVVVCLKKKRYGISKR